MKDTLTLQDEYTELARRCEEKQKQIDQVDLALKKLIANLVDASSTDRPAMIQKRGELVNDQAAYIDELRVITRRRDIAYLAPLELAITQAEQEVEKRQQAAKDSKDAMTAAMNEQLRYFNSIGREKQTTEGDQKRITLAEKKARAKAQSAIDGRDYETAKLNLDRAKGELDRVKAELGTPVL